MPINERGIFIPRDAAELRDNILRDMRLEGIANGIANPPVQRGTDWHILATGVGNMGLMVFARVTLSERDRDVFQATGAALDAIREAKGLPIVQPSPSTGKVYIQTTVTVGITIADGTEFLLPNGKRGKVQGTFLDVHNTDPVDVITIDTGSDTSLAAGEIVRFTAPPLGLAVEAEVSVESPLSGGTDAETDARKRDRILNRLRNVPAGGNVGDLIETALNALGTVQYAFVFPALGGPASVKVVLVRDFDEAANSWTRALSPAAAAIVRAAIQEKLPEGVEVVAQSTDEEVFDAAVKLTIPAAAAAGGNGEGWRDAAPWPPLSGGDTRVLVSVVANGGATITVNASTAVSPVAGQTHIGWWAAADQKFYERLVTAVSGGTGAWVLTLDAALVDSNNDPVAVNDFISPAAVHMNDYAASWRTATRRLGPGENTADGNRLPRALRHPFVTDDWPSDLTVAQLLALKSANNEITDIDWSYRSLSSPTVPASVADAPNVLIPRDFGIYEL